MDALFRKAMAAPKDPEFSVRYGKGVARSASVAFRALRELEAEARTTPKPAPKNTANLPPQSATPTAQPVGPPASRGTAAQRDATVKPVRKPALSRA